MKDSNMKSLNSKKKTNKKIVKYKWSMTLLKEKEKKEHSLLSHLFNRFKPNKNINNKKTSKNITILSDKNKVKFTCWKDKYQTWNKNWKKWKSLTKLKYKIWRQNRINMCNKLLLWNWKWLKVRWRQHKRNIYTTSWRRNLRQ